MDGSAATQPPGGGHSEQQEPNALHWMHGNAQMYITDSWANPHVALARFKCATNAVLP